MLKYIFIFSVIPLLIVLIFLLLRKRKIDLIYSILLTAILYLMALIEAPTLFTVSPKEGVNKVLLFLFNMYEKYGLLYILISSILVTVALYYVSNTLSTHNLYSQKEVNKLFDDFDGDASKLYVINENLHFLDNRDQQFECFKRLKENCTILSVPAKDTVTLDLYEELIESGIKLRVQSPFGLSNFHSLRGQMKVRQGNGESEVLFVEKRGKQYAVSKIVNQYLAKEMIRLFDESYASSIDPLIQFIVVDWSSFCLVSSDEWATKMKTFLASTYQINIAKNKLKAVHEEIQRKSEATLVQKISDTVTKQYKTTINNGKNAINNKHLELAKEQTEYISIVSHVLEEVSKRSQSKLVFYTDIDPECFLYFEKLDCFKHFVELIPSYRLCTTNSSMAMTKLESFLREKYAFKEKKAIALITANRIFYEKAQSFGWKVYHIPKDWDPQMILGRLEADNIIATQ